MSSWTRSRPCLNCSVSAKTVILDAAVLVTGRVFAAGAGLLAQKYVCDAGGFKFLLQIFSIELGFIRL